ncbi:hypothetical protein ACFFK0_17445 [Paenibacillus chartarius]|uniref:Uncharacterized protein n=1 Tax=Paenibacillus chartarius TaxID=747481 RepID=A0ABV6DNJ1_9BACL
MNTTREVKAMQNGDWLVVVLVVAIIVMWGSVRARRWVERPQQRNRFKVPQGEGEVEPNEVTVLLEGAGFEVVAAKAKIPVVITMNDRDTLQSRLYVDYFAVKDDELFIVKAARERKPLELTGSGVRDALLPYYLLYPEASGVLYVDIHIGKIKKFTFDIEV